MTRRTVAIPSSQLSSLAGCGMRGGIAIGCELKHVCKLNTLPRLVDWVFSNSIPGIHPIQPIPLIAPRCYICRGISWVIAWNMSDLIGWRKCVLYKVLESAPDSAYLPINQPGLASAHCCHCDQTKYLNTRIRPTTNTHQYQVIQYIRPTNTKQYNTLDPPAISHPGSNTTDRQITANHFETAPLFHIF